MRRSEVDKDTENKVTSGSSTATSLCNLVNINERDIYTQKYMVSEHTWCASPEGTI